jgi:FAD/FMN-containing dehydrogenase
MNTPQGAKVHVTKIAAAERQLRTAIRMYFAGEDELSVHTLASAACRLLSDLKTARGMDEADNVFLTGIFYVIRDFRRNTLPDDILANGEMMKWIRETAELLPIGADSRIEDVSVAVPPDAARKFWNNRNRVANFLKHADKDSASTISLDEVDNFSLLMQCYSAFVDLTRSQLGEEGKVFQMFVNAKRKSSGLTLESRDDSVVKLTEIPENDRRRFCWRLICKLNGN